MPKEATSFTVKANEALLEALDWANDQDFEAAGRGFIATREEPVIRAEDGRAV